MNGGDFQAKIAAVKFNDSTETSGD